MQLMNLTTLFPIIFNGLALNLNEVAWFPFGWVQYVSAYRYVTEALMHNQYDNDDVDGERILKKFGYDLGLYPCIILLASLVLAF